ncbi:hypothetical protein MKEN_01123600 [Mycena kentingensis (nom. inval.)]|nr:hypothetical protein MKEN_01123600 [Mycena kentingensis (nom. inval.)]
MLRPTLPPEVIDLVIDAAAELRREDRSLPYRCALVSRQWLPRSRFHSFARIHLELAYRDTRVASFLALLCTGAATFLSSIRHLKLVCLTQEQLPTPVLAALVAGGVRAPSLEITTHDILKGGDLDSFAHEFPFVKHLDLAAGNIRAGAPHETFRFLGMFPALQSLVLNAWCPGARRISVLPPQIAQRAFPSGLQELRIRIPSFLEHIIPLERESGAELRSLCIYADQRRYTHLVNEYLALPHIARSLTSLTLHIRASDVEASDQVNLSSLRALRHLGIGTGTAVYTTPTTPQAALHILGISRLERARLQTLSLFSSLMDAPSEFVVQDVRDWAQLDALLGNHADYPSLQRVTVQGMYPHTPLLTQVDWLKAALPTLEKRGLLQM